MDPFDIVIVTNSAGELSTYVKPAVEELSKAIPQARILLVLTPCQYATGRELEEAKSFPGIWEVVIPQEYKKWMLKGKPPTGIKFNKTGLVLYLGGDLLHAVLISKKLKYPAIAYTQKNAHWQRHFKLFLVPDDAARHRLARTGIPEEKLRTVGDLMVDSVPQTMDESSAALRWKINPGNPVISFLPGSRRFQIEYMLPFFLETSKMIQKVVPEAQFLMLLSPYITEDEIKRSLRGEGTIYSQGDLKHIQTKSGSRVQMITSSRHEAISLSTMVLTIPGTNTAEIAAIGTPMIIVFPLDRADSIPLEGISDYICRIPLMGPLLKKIIITIIGWRTKYFGLPNMKAGREIVPELRGTVKPKEVAARAVQCLKDPGSLSEMRAQLKSTMGGRGAAARIAKEITRIMEANS